MLHNFIDWILTTVGDWGYGGIFVLMALESTVLPVPSELVLIPAGYLAHKGEMSFLLIIISSTLGSLLGASVNYAFALWVGRPFLEKYGKYFFVRATTLEKNRWLLCQTWGYFNLYWAIDTWYPASNLTTGWPH